MKVSGVVRSLKGSNLVYNWWREGCSYLVLENDVRVLDAVLTMHWACRMKTKVHKRGSLDDPISPWNCMGITLSVWRWARYLINSTIPDNQSSYHLLMTVCSNWYFQTLKDKSYQNITISLQSYCACLKLVPFPELILFFFSFQLCNSILIHFLNK
jgi:hypothetical protein